MDKHSFARPARAKNSPVRILGIDPGYATVGWGILDYSGGAFRPVDYGAIITTPDLPFEKRLERIFDEVCQLLREHRPTALALEKLYFNQNITTGIDVAQARGVIQLCAVKFGLSIGEYTPQQVKQAVVGYGKAEKRQVMEMTRMLLGLGAVPRPDDTADALAVAVCHAHSASSCQNRMLRQLK